MKKWMIWILLSMLLTGCGAEETFETIADEAVLPVMAQPRQITVQLPEDAVAPVLESEGEQVYVCEDYEIIIETLSSGDVSGTIRTLTGYAREDLTVMETQWQEISRYEFVWAAAGESGERLGRGVILDDGQYHYCMTLLRDAQGKDSQIVWEQVFSSFDLV